jgi:predicted MPP superfamily phosphohydrolase
LEVFVRRSVLSFAFFVAIALSLWGGMHYYVFARLARDPGLPAPWPALLGALLVVLALSVFGAFSRALPKPLAGVVHEVAFTWLGVLFLFDVTLVVGDALRMAFLATAHANTGGVPSHLAAARVQAMVTVAFGLLVTGYAWWSAHRQPPLKKVSVTLSRWPRALSGLRIVQLSDVHVSPNTTPEETRALVERVHALEPDLIALTGDLVDGSPAMLADGIAPLAQLKARLGVFVVTGNHEYYSGGDAWVAQFRKMGFRVLQNERVLVEDRGASFDLAGVPDWTGGQFGAAHAPRLADALAGRDAEREVVLLAHQPKQFPEAAKLGVGLQLSGHTHGGQIWPFTLLVALAERHVAGLHRVGDSQIYVSRGTRYWGPPMRLGAPHELTLLTLESPAA